MQPAIARPGLSLILSVNDLEAEFIVQLARVRSVDVRAFELDWGEIPTLDDPRLDPAGMADHVAIVEMPYPALEERLRNAGKQVTIIDHHVLTGADGAVVDRMNLRCSAAQIVQAFGWRLSEDEAAELAAIEANDIGSWFALLRGFADLPVSDAVERATKIREREEKIRCRFRPPSAAAGGCCSTVLDPGLGNPGHRSLHVVAGPQQGIEAAGEAYMREQAIAAHEAAHKAAHAEACAQALRLKVSPPELLRIGLASPKPYAAVTSLFFSGGAACCGLIDDLVAERAANPDPRLRIFAGRGADYAYLYAEGSPQMLEALAERILGNAVHGARPLEAWQSSFIQALRVPQRLLQASNPRLSAMAVDMDRDFGLVELDLSARNYFLPSLQPMIAPTKQDAVDALARGGDGGARPYPMMTWNIPLGRRFSVRVSRVKHPAVLREPVQKLLVHRGFGDIVYLEWRFGSPKGAGRSLMKCVRKRLLVERRAMSIATARPAEAGERRVGTAAQLVDFNYAARQCYSSGTRAPSDQRIIELIDEGNGSGPAKVFSTHFGNGDSQNVVNPQGWFEGLVGHALSFFADPAAGPPSPREVTLLMDERARFVSTMALSGGPADLAAGGRRSEVLRARFAGGDDFQDGHFYHAPFALEELDRGTYDRFAPYSRYQATSHSFTLMGYGWVPANLLIEHMSEHYSRMFLVAQSYVSTFQSLWQDLIAHSADGVAGAGAERRAVEQRRKFVMFSNAFWFRSLSPQIQGEELFARMRAELPIEREQRELELELANTETLAANDRALKAERLVVVLTVLFGVFAVITAVLEVLRNWVGWKVAAAVGDPTLVSGWLVGTWVFLIGSALVALVALWLYWRDRE